MIEHIPSMYVWSEKWFFSPVTLIKQKKEESIEEGGSGEVLVFEIRRFL